MTTANTIQARQDAARGAGLIGSEVNVGEVERLASKVGGGVLLATGLLRGGIKGMILAGLGGSLLYRGVTGKCELYRALGVDTAHEDGPAGSVAAGSGVRVEEAITIQRSPEDLYKYWRDYKNLPKFMTNIESVEQTGDDKHSHWVANVPLGMKVQWDAELIEDRPGEVIAWRSTGGDVDTAGSVHFSKAVGGRGTVVRVNQKIDPPGGKIAANVAKLIGQDPVAQTRDTLEKFRQLMEAGEIATTTGQPRGSA